MQFLSENLNGSQIFGRFCFLETESEQNFGFSHMPIGRMYMYVGGISRWLTCTW